MINCCKNTTSGVLFMANVSNMNFLELPDCDDSASSDHSSSVADYWSEIDHSTSVGMFSFFDENPYPQIHFPHIPVIPTQQFEHESKPRVTHTLPAQSQPIPIVSVKEEQLEESCAASTNPGLENFMFQAGCGLMTEISRGRSNLEISQTRVNLETMIPRVFVHRREMSCLNRLYHSIRTNTASVVAVCFFGTKAQVIALAHRHLQIFFDTERFEAVKASLHASSQELLVLVKLENVLSNATFKIANGSMASPLPLIYKCDETEGPENFYGVVFEFILTACDTSMKNVLRNRDLVLTACTATHVGSHLSTAHANFNFVLDVQLGTAARGVRGLRKKRRKVADIRGSRFDGVPKVGKNLIPSHYSSDFYPDGYDYPERKQFNLTRKFRPEVVNFPQAQESHQIPPQIALPTSQALPNEVLQYLPDFIFVKNH